MTSEANNSSAPINDSCDSTFKERLQYPCRCGKPRRPEQRNCKDCHAKSAREYRKSLRSRVKNDDQRYHEMFVNNWITKQRFVRHFRSHLAYVKVRPRRDSSDTEWNGHVVAFMPGDIVAVQNEVNRQQIEFLHFSEMTLDARKPEWRIPHEPFVPGHPKDPLVRQILRLPKELT